MRRLHSLMPKISACVLAAAMLLPVAARADQSLLSAVPGNAVVVVHGTASDKDDLIQQYWGEFCDAVLASGVVEDVLALVKQNMPPSEYEQANAIFIQVRNLVTAIDWAALVEQESVFALRWEDPANAFVEQTRTWTNADGTTGSSRINVFRAWPSEIVLFRQTPAALDRNYDGFKSILQTIAGLGPALSFTEGDFHGGRIGTLDFSGVVQIAVARRGDVLGIGLNLDMIDDAFALLENPAAGTSILANERFTSMVGRIPAADTEMSWADFDALFGALRTLFDGALARASSEVPQDAEEIGLVRSVLDRVFDEIAFLDRSYTTVRWESELRRVTESVTTINDAGRDSFLYRALADQHAFTDFHTLVPKDAVNFTFSTGINPLVMYDGIKAAATSIVPEAAQGFDQVEGLLAAQFGIDLRADVLGWVSGELVSIALPSPPMGAQNAATMIRVSDQAKALDAISGVLDFIDGQLKSNGQAGLSLNKAPGALGDKGFITVFNPMLGMMQMTPVVGVTEDYLVIGLTTSVLDKIYATEAGTAPSILDNPRFAAEGLRPDGPAAGVTYQDLEKAMMDLQMAAGMVVPMLSMAAAGAGGGPEGQVMTQIVMSVQKLLPALGHLNFFKSKASVLTSDGDAWHLRSVTTYKRK